MFPPPSTNAKARPLFEATTESPPPPPSGAGVFAAAHPKVYDAFAALGAATADSGPLDATARRLVKLALAIGAGAEGAVHSHTRQARDEGIAPEAIRHVAVLAITTLGFPAAMAGWHWVNDVLNGRQ